MSPFHRKLWLGLALMALLTPLGLALPAYFGAGDAWGEWSAEALHQVLGYVPTGLARYTELWPAPLPDYRLGGAGQSAGLQLVSYAGSALGGALAVGLAAYGLSRLLVRHER